MAYARDEKIRNALSGTLSGAGTGAGIGMTIGGPPGAAIGAGIGAIVGGIGGYFLTDDEKNELIEMYRQGKLDDATVANIEGTIARRYNMLRRSQSAAFTRGGVDTSSFAMRQLAETNNAERQNLVDAITGETERRQAIGFGLSDEASARRLQEVASGVGAAFEGYQLFQENEAMKADAASQDRLLKAIGELLEDGDSGTAAPNKPKVALSKTGAGNPFSRHRARAPNVATKWDALKNSANVKPKVNWDTPKPKLSWLQ